MELSGICQLLVCINVVDVLEEIINSKMRKKVTVFITIGRLV
jgi:hypothetical protein